MSGEKDIKVENGNKKVNKHYFYC